MNENFEIVKVSGFVQDKHLEKFPPLLKEACCQAQKALRRPAEKVPCNWANPRLVNCFKVGCDPEFVVLDSFGSAVHAHDMGLGTGTAYGADGSGRPVELRAQPSRFVVEVVASLLDTLRLFNAHIQSARTSNHWMTGGLVGRESIGGHVHFGRRQVKLRRDEVKVLDKVVDLLDSAGLFLDTRRRRQERGSYGMPSDHRQQTYGYEYRVPPSWLMSIGSAHLVMTLSKLAVVDRRLWNTISWSDKNGAIELLQKVLSGYRYLDEDANLAFRALTRTLSNPNMNFKAAWGCGNVAPQLPAGYATPELVPPTQAALRDVVDHLTNGTVPSYRLPVDQVVVRAFDRSQYKLDKPFSWALANPDGNVVPALQELVTIQDGLILKQDSRGDVGSVSIMMEKSCMMYGRADQMRAFMKAIRIAPVIRLSMYRASPTIANRPPWTTEGCICMGVTIPTSNQGVKLANALVESGAFPIFRVQNLPSADCVEHWKRVIKQTKNEYTQYRRK